jgi:large subunit ribosomal protein L2
MKRHKPITPGRRGMTGINFRDFLTTSKPLKKLTKPVKKTGGRGNSGRITVRHIGGGHKKRYRLVDFRRKDFDIPAKVEEIEYDPARTAFIARIVYKNGKRTYVLAPQNLKTGDEIISSEKGLAMKVGNRMPLKEIPVGTFVYNIELQPGQGGKISRSAGSSAQLVAKEGKYANLLLPSTEVRRVLSSVFASVGVLSNPENRMINVGKAGRSRWLGIRPTVRGSAMNPVDHPLGGGEGKAPAGMKRPKNKWGKGIRGVKTRDKKKASNKFIIKKRKRKPRKK